MEVKPQQITNLSNRLPKLELSYETVVHKKVSPIYDICVSIPTGKRQFVWFTYDEDGDVCYLMDLTRDGKIGHIEHLHVDFKKLDTSQSGTSQSGTSQSGTSQLNTSFYYGTILYGTLCVIDGLSFFIADDIYYYKGIYTKPLTFGEKFGFLSDVVSRLSFDPPPKGAEMNGLKPLLCASSIQNASRIIIKMACIETVSSENQSVCLEPAYVSHHLQYRSSSQVMPYLNQTVKTRSFVTTPAVEPKIYIPRNDLDFSAPTYKTEVVFRVMADIQSDIYLLYAFNNDVFEFVDIAYIGSRKESAFMNSLFRNIRENLNVDYGEESEDEDMFQNTSVDKYVDLKTEYKMICSFHHKFKKWVPVRTVDAKTRCVNMNQLTRRQGSKPLVSDASRPSRSDTKPLVSDASRPYRSDSSRPYQSDSSRSSGSGYTKPYRSDASRPSGSNTKPYQSVYMKPYGSDASRPYQCNTARPYQCNTARPYPKAPNLTIPVETQSQQFSSKPLEKKPFQHNRERKLC
jgi:hypothetical protein